MQMKSLRLNTANAPALQAFYTDILGLPVVATSAQEFTLQVGATEFTFVQTGEAPIYHFAFNIPENQFAEAKAWLAERVPLVQDSSGDSTYRFESWNALAVYFYDAAGNIVELIARHALPTASDTPFGPASLLSVSEIGWVVADVRAAVATLHNNLGLSVYANSLSDEFAAVGDEHGLFIVVKQERPWFPDMQHILPAKSAPIQVTLIQECEVIQWST